MTHDRRKVTHVMHSIYEASERDFRVVAVRDAISRLDEAGERELVNIGVEILTASAAARCVRVTRHHTAGATVRRPFSSGPTRARRRPLSTRPAGARRFAR